MKRPVNTRHRRFIEKKIRNKVGSAIRDYNMISSGDRVLVAVSGGKDSIVLLKILADMRRAAPFDFTILPVHLHTGFDIGFERIALWFKVKGRPSLEIKDIDTNISEVLRKVSDPKKSPCGLCSRLRRGILYRLAKDMGVSSIALGHHMDDIIETFLLRVFYTGQIGAMSPSRISNDGQNRVIRPLAYCTKELVQAYFSFFDIEPVSIRCPIRTDSKREMLRRQISTIENKIPNVKYSIFASLGNIDERSLCLKEKTGAYNH